MLVAIITIAIVLQTGLIIGLIRGRNTLLGERKYYPGIFIKYKKNKNGTLSLIYSNDESIKELGDIIPPTHINHCSEIFDDFMTNGISEFTCEKDGFAYNISVKKAGKNIGFAIVSDVTSIKRMGDRAFLDALTGLPNRLSFNERVKAALAYASMNERIIAVMFLDLDKFKAVNDTYGHEAGDILLKQVSQRLSGVVRAGDTVARLGGDEFTILLPHVAKVDFAYNIAERIITELTTPFDLDGVTANIGTSIGIAIFPNHGTTAETIIKHADEAMYAAKKGGRGIYKIYGEY